MPSDCRDESNPAPELREAPEPDAGTSGPGADKQQYLQAGQGHPLSREPGKPRPNEKALQTVKQIRCVTCRRLLAMAGTFDELQIKCPRCGALNHLKAESLPAPPGAAVEVSCPLNRSSPG